MDPMGSDNSWAKKNVCKLPSIHGRLPRYSFFQLRG